MRMFAILISVLVNGSIGFSAVEPICTDLAAQVCSTGIRNDGTGETKYIDPVVRENYRASQLEPILQSSFAQKLKRDPNFVTNMIFGFAAEQEPACKITKSAECRKLLSEKLAQYALTLEFGDSYKNKPKDYRAVNALIVKTDHDYKAIVKEVAKHAQPEIPQELQDKVSTKIYPQVKELLLRKIAQLPLDDLTKSKMKSYVSVIDFKGFDCTDEDTNGLANAFRPQAFFDPRDNKFTICRSWFEYSTSEFDIAQTIAHELAHAIDPCGMGSGTLLVPPDQAKTDLQIDNEYLRENFVSCLRSKKSSHSLAFAHPLADAPTGKLAYNDTARLCKKDQINETTADWFSAEVIGEYLPTYLKDLKPEQRRAGVANLLRINCLNDKRDQSGENLHPDAKDRINGIISVQPKIREYMGCKNDTPERKYCDINNPVSLIENTAAEPAKSKKKKSNGSVQ